MPHFESVAALPEDPLYGLAIAFAADSRPLKVDLGIGTYRDADGKPSVMVWVRKAEQVLFDKQLDKEYLPLGGNAAFLTELQQLTFGKALQKRSGCVFAMQALGGTGALRLGGDFLAEERSRTIF